MKEARVELKYPEQLAQSMDCPNCGNPVSNYTMYKCPKCKIQIVFFLCKPKNGSKSGGKKIKITY